MINNMKMTASCMPFSVIVFVVTTLLKPRPSECGSHHNLIWKGPENTTLGESLRSNWENGDFFYLFMGDTQHFFPCNAGNTACRAITPECTDPWTDTSSCIERQSEWSNKYQKMSMEILVAHLQALTGHIPKALVINGDTTQNGEPVELARFKKMWEKFDTRFRTLPGLGNHDYFNNVGHCENNYCVERVLAHFTEYTTKQLGMKLDLTNRTNGTGRKPSQPVVSGSLAYSWDEECASSSNSSSSCFHFVQQNNYPTYTKEIITNVSTWKISSSLSWLEKDLKRRPGIPTILNFHDFDTAFSEADKRDFKRVVLNSKADVVAVFFAHIHEKVGLRSVWCAKSENERAERRPIWFIYSGSVPGNNYVLAHLSPIRKTLKKLYKIHVANETTSFIEIEESLNHPYQCNKAATAASWIRGGMACLLVFMLLTFCWLPLL